MKRYVTELANDCKRELKHFEKFALNSFAATGDNRKTIKKLYAEKYRRIDELVEQCRYGYISEMKAVELIVAV